MNWYPRYYGDYMKCTAHLSLAEHGAYTVLLDHYYGSEQPLEASGKALYRICRAFDEEERAAVDSVCAQFFPIREDGKRHNKRADEEIAKANSINGVRSKAGSIGASKRWGKTEDSKCHSTSHSKRIAIATTSTPTTTDTSTDTPIPPKPPAAFAAWYSAYPKKTGKIAAQKAWIKMQSQMPDIDQMLAKLNAQRTSEAWTKDGGQYVPNPSTYLSQGRWDDDVQAASGANRKDKPSTWYPPDPNAELPF